MFIPIYVKKGKLNMNKSRKKQEFDFKKNLIINAAKTIFFDKGFETSTIDDIAKEAGYSKGSIYSYFKSKNEICFSIVNTYFKNILDFIQVISNEDLDGLSKLKKIKEKFINDYAGSSDFCTIFDSFRYHKSQCMQVEEEILRNLEYNKTINSLFYNIINEGIEDKSIKECIDSKKLANALWNVENSFISELRSIDQNSYDYVFDLILESIKK